MDEDEDEDDVVGGGMRKTSRPEETRGSRWRPWRTMRKRTKRKQGVAEERRLTRGQEDDVGGGRRRLEEAVASTAAAPAATRLGRRGRGRRAAGWVGETLEEVGEVEAGLGQAGREAGAGRKKESERGQGSWQEGRREFSVSKVFFDS